MLTKYSIKKIVQNKLNKYRTNMMDNQQVMLNLSDPDLVKRKNMLGS